MGLRRIQCIFMFSIFDFFSFILFVFCFCNFLYILLVFSFVSSMFHAFFLLRKCFPSLILNSSRPFFQVSDSTGFGSGGTSVAAQVTNSNDASCFDAKTNVSPDFYFSIQPVNQIVQCTDTRLWWNSSSVQGYVFFLFLFSFYVPRLRKQNPNASFFFFFGKFINSTPNFLGVIPGGQSFAIPEGNITDVPSQGTGFTWKPSLRGGTTLIIVGGDNRGNGTAGSTLNVVSSGVNNDGSCLSNSSPSSTPGTPAGGSYPTGSS